MGLLDKIYTGDYDKSGSLSSKIEQDVQNLRQKQQASEQELQLRRQLGQEVDTWSIQESRKKGLPYECFFDWEVEMVEKGITAKDNLKGTLQHLTCAQDYLVRNSALEAGHPLRDINIQHSLYWIDRLYERAEQGSIYAQAALTGQHHIVKVYSEIASRIDELLGTKKDDYLRNVIEGVNANDPKAMLAYAYFHMIGKDVDEEKKKQLYQKAGKLGLSEAYERLFYLTKDRWESQEGFEIALAAAECDDGETAYDFQEELGDAYWYSENWGKQQDKVEALYWYQKAANNGFRGAISTLDMLEHNGEIMRSGKDIYLSDGTLVEFDRRTRPAETARFCENCGAKIERSNAKFCTKCGHPLS